MPLEPITLEGSRVRLEPLREEHAELLLPAALYPDIWTYLFHFIRNLEDIQRLIRDAIILDRQGNDLHFAVYDKESATYVGSTSFMDYSPGNRGLEIGSTWYTPAVWRTRVNTECKYLMLRHSFETLGLIRVQLKTDARNTRSQEAISRIGGKHEGVLRKHRILPDGYIRDTVMFSILDTEWPDVKQRLEAFLSR